MDNHVALAIADIKRRCSQYAATTVHTEFLSPSEMHGILAFEGERASFMARVVASPIFVFICILNDASGDVFAPVDGGSHYCSLVLVKNCYGAHARLDEPTGNVSENMLSKATRFLKLFRASLYMKF